MEISVHVPYMYNLGIYRADDKLYHAMTRHIFRISLIIVSLLLSSSFFVAISSTGSEDYPQEKADTITFAAGGDHYNGGAFEAAMDTLVAANTDFYIANGDLGFTGPGNEQSWCDQVIAKVGSDYPFQLLSGNHDDDGSSDGEISGYVQCLPDHMNSVGTYGGQYYFDYPSASPLVRSIMLPADLTVFGVTHDYVQGDSHYNWVSSTIDDARANNIPWVVVAMHKACITTGPKGSCEVGTDLFDLLMDKKVDLIFHGHVHTNERSKQLSCVVPDTYDSSCVVDDGSDDHYVKGQGPVIVIGGPMGQGTRSVNPSDPEAGYFAKIEGGSEGFYKYTVTADSIEAVYHASSGSHTDSFIIGPNDQPFTVNLNPKSDSANPGEVVTSSVQVNGVSAVPVTLSSSGCPVDATCVISPSSGAPPFSATLTITTASTTPLNIYPIIVTGMNGTRTDSDTFTLTVEQTVTRTYQKGDGGLYSEIDDTYIFDGAPNTNFGADSELFMDTAGCDTGGNVCKALIKFPNLIGLNSGQIPTGVAVQSANLEFTVTDPGSAQNVYQVSESWEEMTATWNSFAVAGSPGIKLLLGTITPNTGRMSIDITDIVQNWVNGDANEGILFDPTSGNGADLDSSESANPQKLTVVYAPAGSNNFPSLDAPSVSPSSGTQSTTFTYQVKYSDIDNDAPAAGNPKVHISKGGSPISGSPFTMTLSGWVEGTDDYVQGAIYTHDIQFTSPGFDYSYHLTTNDANGAGTSTISQDAPDVTSGTGGVSISFGAGGDHGWNSNTDATLDALAASGTDFFLSVGDLSYDGLGSEQPWCDYVKSKVGADYPFQLVSGDHEDDVHLDGWIGDFIQCLPDRMGSAGVYGAEYYFDYPAADSLVRAIMITPDIVVLGEQRDYRVGDQHYIWLSNTIDDARAQGIPWVVVGMHRNCITTGIKICAIGTDLWDLLMEKKVDVVLQGNDHNYQRSKQLSCATPDTYDPNCVVDDGSDNLYAKGAGSVLVITGNFGISLYPVDPTDAEAGYFTQINDDTYGYTHFDVTANRMDIRLVNTVGSFTDSFSIVSDGGEEPGPSSDCTKIAIPAYFYPGQIWDQAIADAPVTDIMIMNPSNGPGSSFNSAYGATVTEAQAAGIKILGYVYTLYGVRDSAIVEAEIDSYMNWYGVDGIFLDEVSNDAADLAFYRDIANYIRSKPGDFIMINPGTVTDEQYMEVADVVTIFESYYSSYVGATFPSWIDNYHSSRFLHLVHDTPPESFADAWNLAQERNSGYIYITDDAYPNPWDTLPTYWDSEVAACRNSCGPKLSLPTVAPMSGITTTTFTYEVKYNNSGNYAPAIGYPKVHISKGGAPIAGAPFSMTLDSWIGVQDDYIRGAIYAYSMRLAVAGSDYSFFFEAQDSNGAGTFTSSTNAPVVNEPSITDSIEPTVTGLTINGQSSLTVLQSSPPSDLSLQATIDDTSRGDSKIAGANFTINGDWAGAQLLDPADGNFDSSIEGVVKTMPVPSMPGARAFCVFGWDEWMNLNTTGQCAIVTVVDDVAPVVSVVDSPDPKNQGGTVTFEATATDNVGISDVSINITDPIGSAMGNFSMDLDVPSGKWIYSSTFAEPGTHTFVAWAKDTSNNWASTSGEFDIVQVQDTTPPTISSVQDSPDPQTSGGAVGFEAVVMDDVSVSEVWIEILDPTGISTGNFTMGFDTPSGKWIYSSTFTETGVHTYTVRARDASSNWASALGSFLIVQAIDVTPPSIISVQDSPDPQEVGEVVEFRANVADNVGVTAVMLKVGPGNYSMVYDSASGEWLHSMAFDTAQLYAYSVWAYDAAGNVANGIGSTLIVDSAGTDTTPPEVTMVSAHPSPQFKTEPVRISAVVTDNDEVKSVYVKIVDKNGVVLGNISMIHNDTSGMWERTLVFVNAGGYSFIIWAEDASGNIGWAPGALNIINSVSKGMIKGRIVDADGNPIADATVTLVDGKGSTVTTSVTGNDGTYSMKDIEPGVYTVKILKPGYETETTDEIVIGEGDNADLGSTMLLPELQNPESDGNLMLIMLFILAIVVVALVLMILLYRRKKKKVSRDY
jgi:hypothetical protein